MFQTGKNEEIFTIYFSENNLNLFFPFLHINN